MKYTSTFPVPAEQREQANAEIVRQIVAGENPPHADVFACYTGLGGLHGEDFNEHNNFHEYTKAKQSKEFGQFMTPSTISEFIKEILAPTEGAKVLELCCGHGNFINSFDRQRVTGIEFERNAHIVAQYLYPEARIIHSDMRDFAATSEFDFVVGNPPFNLRIFAPKSAFANENLEAASQDVYLERITEALKSGGIAAFVVPATWLSDAEMTHKKQNEFIDEHFLRVAEVFLPETVFQGYGCARFATKIVVIAKKIGEEQATTFAEIDATDGDFERATKEFRRIGWFQSFLYSLSGARAIIAYKNMKQNAQESAQSIQDESRYAKAIYDLTNNAPHAVEEIEKMWAKTFERKPENVTWETWEEQKMTPEKVFAAIRKIYKKKPDQNIVRLVKHNYGWSFKAYSHEASNALRGIETKKAENYELINPYFNSDLFDQVETVRAACLSRESGTRFEATPSKKWLRKKQAEFELLSRNVSEYSPEIAKQLMEIDLGVNEQGVKRRLVEKQAANLAPLVEKGCGILNNEQGTGKTLCSIAWAEYFEGQKVVVAPSIAIELTWMKELTLAGRTFQRVKSVADLETDSEFLLVSFSLLDSNSDKLKYTRLKKWLIKLAKIGKLQALIVDESDTIKNAASVCTQAALAFGRKIPHRLVMSGTVTRNTPVEIYTQIELAMNNHAAMRCTAPMLYEYDRKEKEIAEVTNRFFQMPYSAKKGGHRGIELFRRSHAPKKTTVFGEKKDQGVLLQRESLRDLLRMIKTRLTFRDLKGFNPFIIETKTAPISAGEMKLYDNLFENVRAFLSDAMNESKKASMLILAQQIMLLLRAASCPFVFEGYESVMPSKANAILDHLEAHSDELVTIGTRNKPTVEHYAKIIKNRPVFAFDGETSLSSRSKIIEAFKASKNGVLVVSQGALSVSVSIPECENVVIESLPWNYATLGQFAARFARFTSANPVRLTTFVLEDTLENNLIALLLEKEKVNRFIADDVLVTDEELYKEFDVDEDVLDSLIQIIKEEDTKTKKTHAKLAWGRQKEVFDQALALSAT